MLKRLTIENFKCFTKESISFAPLTVLVGGNGAGKSTIIQSLLLLKYSSDYVVNYKASKGISVFQCEELDNLIFDVPLNGHYLLQLGRFKEAYTSNPTESEYISFVAEEEKGRTSNLSFREHTKYVEHLFQGEFFGTHGIPYFPFEGDFHYLNAERLGPRKSLEMSPESNISTGHRGEYTSYLIYQADMESVHIADSLRLDDTSIRFTRQLEAWLSTIIPNLQLDYQSIAELGMISLKYRNKILDTAQISAPNTGFGISYLLPIIASGLYLSSKEDATLIVENPEAHLHPYSQSRLGKFLAYLSIAGIQVIVETHSEHIVNGMRIQMAHLKKSSEFIINYFSQENGVTVEQITSNEVGELSSWPKGFFDQEQADLKELFMLKKKRGK